MGGGASKAGVPKDLKTALGMLKARCNVIRNKNISISRQVRGAHRGLRALTRSSQREV